MASSKKKLPPDHGHPEQTARHNGGHRAPIGTLFRHLRSNVDVEPGSADGLTRPKQRVAAEGWSTPEPPGDSCERCRRCRRSESSLLSRRRSLANWRNGSGELSRRGHSTVSPSLGLLVRAARRRRSRRTARRSRHGYNVQQSPTRGLGVGSISDLAWTLVWLVGVGKSMRDLVGAEGFEPSTSWSRTSIYQQLTSIAV